MINSCVNNKIIILNIYVTNVTYVTNSTVTLVLPFWEDSPSTRFWDICRKNVTKQRLQGNALKTTTHKLLWDLLS